MNRSLKLSEARGQIIPVSRRTAGLRTTAGFITLAAFLICALPGQSRAQNVLDQKSNPLIELEYQQISVPNSSTGKILSLSEESKMYPLVLDMLHRNAAELYDISKAVSPSGRKAVVTAGKTQVEMEPILSPHNKTVDLNVGVTIQQGKIFTSINIPAGRTLYLGSFDDPRVEANATIFIFAKWKIADL